MRQPLKWRLPYLPAGTLEITCKRCGTAGLYWRLSAKGWVLFYIQSPDYRHICTSRVVHGDGD